MDKPYFCVSVSNWTVKANGFEAKIERILSETITRYANGYVRLNLEVANIHPEVEKALMEGKLVDVTIIREWEAVAVPNAAGNLIVNRTDMETLQEVFENAQVVKVQTAAKPDQIATFRIFARSKK